MKKLNSRSKQTGVSDADDVKKDYEKRIHDLELDNGAFKREIEELRYKLASVSSTPLIGVQKVVELKNNLNSRSQLSTKKHKSEQAAKQFPDEIQKLKAQKVQLQCKIKLDSIQFRLCKASLEKEVLQLKKEQRRNEYEKCILSALNQQQKLVLKQKTEEAFAVTKRLKQLLEFRKTSSHKSAVGPKNANDPEIQDIELGLEVTMRLKKLYSKYERQMEEMVDEIRRLKLGAEILKEEYSGCLLQDSEGTLVDSELRDLKENVASLTTLVSQLAISKSQLSESDKPHVDKVESISVGSSIWSLDMDLSSSEHSEGMLATAEKTTTEVCCSCSKKSLCKTLKCGCRAAGSSCGTSCGCTTSKCTNWEVSLKSDTSRQSKMAEENTTCLSIVGKENAITCASQVSEVEKPSDVNDDGPKEQPLRNIGNTMIKSIATRASRRRKGQKPIPHLDNVDPSSLLPENNIGPRKAW